MLTVTDLFCGAGGSTTGAAQVPGVEVRMAANHWDLAVETHNLNHPATDHDCADVSQVDPRRYPATDLLWASPECTNHSVARGKRRVDGQGDMFGETLPDAAAERSRATMWDVPRFAEHHQYRAAVVENVVDAAKWVMFPAWLHAMDCLGYDHQIVWLNSMHAQRGGLPAPQSRDRVYVVFHRKGDPAPDVTAWTRPQAWCPTCDRVVTAVQSWKRAKPWGRYRAQYVWRCPTIACSTVVEPGWLPAAAAIDWTIEGQRIGDRDKPLAAKTMLRIEAALARYARPVHVEAAGNQYDSLDPRHPQHGSPGAYVRGWPVDEPLRTLHTAMSKGVAWHDAMLVPTEGRDGKQARRSSDPLQTMTTRNETAIVVPMRANNRPKTTSEPFDTFAAAGLHHALLMRNYTARGDQGQMSTPVTDPMRTLTAAGNQSLLIPAGGSWNDTATPTSDPMRARTTRESEALLDWRHVLVDFNGPARPVTDPLPTQTTVEGDALASVEVAVEDCRFRMLEPSEIAAGMAFPHDYRILGNRRERVRQAGNAVTPPAARDLISAVAEALS